MHIFQNTKVSQLNGSFIRCEVFATMIIQDLFSGLYYCVILSLCAVANQNAKF